MSVRDFMVAVDCDGEVNVHATGNHVGPDYATLCGLDGSDSGVGQKTVALPRGARIDCAQCRSIIEFCKTVPRAALERS